MAKSDFSRNAKAQLALTPNGQRAVEEQDPEELMKLIGEVNQLLENNEERLLPKSAA